MYIYLSNLLMPTDKCVQNKTVVNKDPFSNKPIVLATKKSRFLEITTRYFMPTPKTLIYYCFH